MAEEVAEKELGTMTMEEYAKARAGKPAEKAVEEPVEEEAKPEEKAVEEQQEEKPKSKAGGGFQKRIERLVKSNAQLEDELEKARKELAASRGEKVPEKKAEDQAPKLEDFTSYEDWIRASARWEARAELRAAQLAREQEEEKASIKEVFDAHNERIAQGRAKYEDYDEVVGSANTPWKENNNADMAASQAFQIALFETDNGEEILYYLGQNHDEMDKFAGLSPAKVAMRVGILSERLAAQQEKDEEPEEKAEDRQEEQPAAKKKPIPMKPVGTGATRSSVPLDKMSMEDYKKARAAGRTR